MRDRCTIQVVYALTSPDADRAGPNDLLAQARNHWGIENTAFHVKDVTFREDHCRVLTDQAPAALGHIRNAALNIIRKRGLKPRPAR